MSELAVHMRDLWFSYDGQPVLREVNLRIERQEIVAVVGPNGGGKTTLIKLMLGLLTPTRGTVEIFGAPPARSLARIGYTPQFALFDPKFPVSVLDVTLMGRLGRARRFGPFGHHDRRTAEAALREVEMWDLRSRGFSLLSGGQRQRVLIARALAAEPDLLLLDEPMANLDVRAEQEFAELLGRLARRLTIIVVSHDVGFVSERFNKIVCVRGSVAMHATAALTGQALRDLYGQDVRLIRHDHDCAQHDAKPLEGPRDDR